MNIHIENVIFRLVPTYYTDREDNMNVINLITPLKIENIQFDL